MIGPTNVMHPLPVEPVDTVVRTRPQTPPSTAAGSATATMFDSIDVPADVVSLADAIRQAASHRLTAAQLMQPLPVIDRR